MAEPTGYAHAATLATGDPDLAVRLAGELREARETTARLRADVMRALGRFERNLVYTAPELWHTRVVELREEIEYALEDPPDGTSWCKCDDCWGWFIEDHPGEDLDALGADRSWWSGLPEHRSRPPDGTS